MKYDKLVRDNIPQIIRKSGGKPVIRMADKTEFEAKLREKLQEEVSEFLQSGSNEELADILEVSHALAKLQGMTEQGLEQLRKQKQSDRGGFEKRIILTDDGVKKIKKKGKMIP